MFNIDFIPKLILTKGCSVIAIRQMYIGPRKFPDRTNTKLFKRPLAYLGLFGSGIRDHNVLHMFAYCTVYIITITKLCTWHTNPWNQEPRRISMNYFSHTHHLGQSESPTLMLNCLLHHFVTRGYISQKYSLRKVFMYRALQLWNSLLLNIRTVPPVECFKSRFKSFVFESAFPTFFQQSTDDAFQKTNVFSLLGPALEMLYSCLMRH